MNEAYGKRHVCCVFLGWELFSLLWGMGLFSQTLPNQGFFEDETLSLEVKTFPVSIDQRVEKANCYVAWLPESRQAVVVDPGAPSAEILEFIRARRLKALAILNTMAMPIIARETASWRPGSPYLFFSTGPIGHWPRECRGPIARSPPTPRADAWSWTAGRSKWSTPPAIRREASACGSGRSSSPGQLLRRGDRQCGEPGRLAARSAEHPRVPAGPAAVHAGFSGPWPGHDDRRGKGLQIPISFSNGPALA